MKRELFPTALQKPFTFNMKGSIKALNLGIQFARYRLSAPSNAHAHAHAPSKCGAKENVLKPKTKINGRTTRNG